MNILVIEPSANGHRFQYLAWVARAFLQGGHTVAIGTRPENRSHPLLLSLQSEFSDQVWVCLVPGREKKKFLFREISNWLWFRKTYKKAVHTRDIDRVFVPYMDHIFYAMALLGSPFKKTLFSGIIMVPTFHHRQFGILRPRKNKDLFEKALFAKCFRPLSLRTVFTIDPILCKSTYGNNKLRYLPDPSSEVVPITQKKARERLCLENLEHIILVFGAITDRKGIKDLIETVAKYDLEIHILVVGVHDIATMHLLDTDAARYLFRKNRLTSVNQYIPANLETAYYCASDIIWLGYRGHYAMSGVLVKAATCERRVLACQDGLIGLLTEKYKLGLTANINKIEDVAHSIQELLSAGGFTDPVLRLSFVEQHELKKFLETIAYEL